MCFGVTEWILNAVASGAPIDPSWHGALPIFPLQLPHAPAPAFALFVLLSLVETAALIVLWRTFSERAPTGAERGFVGFAALASCAIAFTADTTTSADLYLYVAYALVPNAYAPSPLPGGSPFAAAEAIWGRPVQACIYGPLWVSLDRLLLLHVGSFAEAIIRLRLLSLAGFVALAVALRFAGGRFALLALLLLNPGFWRLWIADAHMDLPALAGILAGGAFAARGRLAAGLPFLIAAGLYKITLGAIGLVAIESRAAPRRIAAAAFIWIAIAALSWLLGGRPYVDALRGVGAAHTTLGLVGAAHLVVVACAGVAIAAIVVGARTWRGATWTLATIGATLTPWYAGWSLPYAIRAGYAATFLIVFPVVAATVGTYSTVLGYAVLVILTLAAGFGPCRRGCSVDLSDGDGHGEIAVAGAVRRGTPVEP